MPFSLDSAEGSCSSLALQAGGPTNCPSLRCSKAPAPFRWRYWKWGFLPGQHMSQILLLCRIDLSLFFLEQPDDPTRGLLRPRRLKHPPGHPAPPRSVSQRTYVESNRGWHLATCPGGAQRIYGFQRICRVLRSARGKGYVGRRPLSVHFAGFSPGGRLQHGALDDRREGRGRQQLSIYIAQSEQDHQLLLLYILAPEM